MRYSILPRPLKLAIPLGVLAGLLLSTCALAKNSSTTQTETKSVSDNKNEKAEAVAVTSPPPVSHWDGTNVQLGFTNTTGNSNDTNFTVLTNLKYANDAWLNNARLGMQLNRSSHTTTKENYFAADQIQYNFSETRQNYVYTTVDCDSDRFSPYEYQIVTSGGYGRDLVKKKAITWSAQFGPGVRYYDIRDQVENQKNFVVATKSTLTWAMSKSINLSESLQYTFGKPFNYLQSGLAITNKITGNLALQLSYNLQDYSKIPLDSTNTKNLDTTTNVTLVYNL